MGRPNISEAIQDIAAKNKAGLSCPEIVKILDEQYCLTPKRMEARLVFMMRQGLLRRKKVQGIYKFYQKTPE